MARTINGKSFSEVEKSLIAPFQPKDFKTNLYGFSYLEVGTYKKRMDEVIGKFNYDFITSEVQTSIIGTRPQIYMFGTIVIRDDNGNHVASRSSGGGAEVGMLKKTGEPVNFKNSVAIATADVYKNCCQEFGIGVEQLKMLRKDNQGANKDIGAGSTGTESISLYRVKLRESFSNLGKNNNGYSAMVDVEGESEPRKLVIWQSAIDEIEKYIPIAKFVSSYKANMEFSLFGMLNVWTPKNGGKKELQLFMDKPYVNVEGS